MMFRFGKIVESSNKSSRSDRFAEMSKQQQLIESKKLEIKAKFEEMKRKETDDSPKKTEMCSSTSKLSKDIPKTLTNSRIQSWKNDDRWRKKHNNNEGSGSESSSAFNSNNNIFSNDGSFMEKFRQMSGNSKGAKSEDSGETDCLKHTCDKHYSENLHSDNQRFRQNIDRSIMPRNEGIPYPPPNLNILPTSSALVTPQTQSLYSLTAHPPPSVPTSIHTSLTTVPGSVSVLSAVPSSAASLQTVSLIQVPVSVPTSSVILSCPLETTLVSSESVVHLPIVHSTFSHSSMTVPLQTTVIPAQIQITSRATVPPVNAMQTVQINQSSTNVILPQSIIVPQECVAQPPTVPTALPNTNVPPPMLPVPPPSQPPPVFSAAPPPIYSMPPHSVTPDTSTLPPIHLPPPNFNPIAGHYPEGVPHASPLLDCKTSVKLEKYGFGNERTIITSEADERRTMRAFRQDGGRDSSVDSLENIEAVARVVADCGDDMETVLLSQSAEDPKLRFLFDKQSPMYFAFRSMVEKFRKDGGVRRETDSGNRYTPEPERKRCSRVPADEDDSDSEESEEKRKKRRKRRSRWAPEDTKVDVPPPVMVANMNVGIGTPLPLGNVPPPTQQSKLPGMSGSLISQVTRTDPALLQYALKAFGTINLSEEDWKKAEDHYKINLLYQDMLKKRQELEKLQAAGKHKYAYDSDEDTEGGTWEHKLRQQEMVATQLWADELTERSKGKHHIGDFLPPDELERFMEKYNALKQGREPDLSDYKEFKLREDNIGFQMLQKLGWSEGQGLGSDGTGIVNPVNKAPSYTVSHGLGVDKPDDIRGDDDEYDAYRKRMMLAYRFRPNPLNNPRRPYY